MSVEINKSKLENKNIFLKNAIKAINNKQEEIGRAHV